MLYKKEKKMKNEITLKEKIAYVMANLGNIPIQTVVGTYLMIFYVTVCGIDPAVCATLFLIARICDAINDPFIGFLIDRIPTTKFGHFRKSLIVGSVLCGINFLLMWYGPLMLPAGKVVIAYITYLLLGVLFPVMDISLNSLLPVMTTNIDERNGLGALKGFFYSVGSTVIAMIAPLIIGDTSKRDGYVVLIALVAAIVIICSVVGALGVKERVVSSPSERYSIKDLFKIIVQKPVIISFLTILLYMGTLFMAGTVEIFFFSYILHDLKMYSVLILVTMIVSILPMALLPKVVGRFGKKAVFTFGLAVYGVVPLIRFLNPLNIPLLVISYVALGIGSGFVSPLIYIIQADNTDYVKGHLHKSAEGAIASLNSFITKLSMGVAGAIPGYLLAMVNFDSTLDPSIAQPAGVNTVIMLCLIGIPAVLCVVSAVIFGAFYPLTKEKLLKQEEEVARLREANSSSN